MSQKYSLSVEARGLGFACGALRLLLSFDAMEGGYVALQQGAAAAGAPAAFRWSSVV